MTATLEEIDRRQAAPADVEALWRIATAINPISGDVTVACNDVRRDHDELVIELEVHLPLREPVRHPIPGFHADVTGV